MKAVIILCFITIIALVLGVNLMGHSKEAPIIEQSEVTIDVPH